MSDERICEPGEHLFELSGEAEDGSDDMCVDCGVRVGDLDWCQRCGGQLAEDGRCVVCDCFAFDRGENESAGLGIAILRVTRDAIEAHTPYSPLWVERVKKTIPHTQRSWDERRKTWMFALRPDLEQWLVKLCHEAGWPALVEVGQERTTYYPDGQMMRERQEDLFG